MNKNILKKTLIVLLGIIAGVYILFLALPLFLIPVLDMASSKTAVEIEKLTGFRAEFTKFRIVTTPKLTVGVKLQNAKIYEPNGDLFLDSSNLQIKTSILPLLLKKIELDLISADDINLNIKLNPDGTIFVADYFKQQETETKTEDFTNKQPVLLPFGLKLSNNLPDIRVKKHNISFIDIKTGKIYALTGSNSNITDFVLNKKIKVESEGKIVLDGFETFNYEIDVFNRLMPDIDINELVFASSSDIEKKENNQDINFNILEFFKQIKNKQIKSELDVELDISGNFEKPVLVGEVSLDKISMLLNGKMLPESNVELEFNKDGLEIESNFYTAENENTIVDGLITHKKLDLTCKSNAGLKNIFEITKEILSAVGISDFDTLNVAGKLDTDFKIESDYKKIISNGSVKLLSGALKWGLYDVKIDNIGADISLDNNTVLINKLGFSTFSVPLTITGKITPDAKMNINVSTTKLILKSLLVSLGQGAILKENPIYSGFVSVNANVSGALTSPSISGKVDVSSLKLKNVPSDITLSFNPLNINLESTKTGFKGSARAQNIKLTNPAFVASAASMDAALDENSITINPAKAYFGKNEFNLSGTITDYLKEKILLDFLTEGKLNAALKGFINPYNMTLGLDISVLNNSEVIIPGFDKSKVIVNGSVQLHDSLLNPILSGKFDCPSISIPEIPVSMKNSVFNLNGVILNGSASVEEFVSGGIKASNITSDFQLKGNDFYLNNLKGSAFDGKFDGNIAYNLQSTLCKVILNGASMNALKAIEGAAGIKNALTGTLSFNSNINFKGVDYNDMMKSLKGGADFQINNGVLANLGGLKTLLNAQNIVNNVILKQTVEKVSTLAVVQQTSEFNYIKGDLTFSGGYANLDNITMQGPKMAYYITGRFNLISGSIDAVVLGRLSGDVVNVLGNLGTLASNSISSLIPGFGSLTASIAKMLNESPKNVDISKIPSLSAQADTQKEFKAVYQGTSESSSAVKSFKWINDADTSSVEQTQTTTTTVSDVKENIKQNVDSAVNTVKTNITTGASSGKEVLNTTKEQAKEQAKELINSLFNRSNATLSE